MGEVVIEIPYTTLSPAEVVAAIQEACGVTSGTAYTMTPDAFSDICSIMQASTAVPPYPVTLTGTASGGISYTISTADSPGMRDLISAVRGLAGIPVLVVTHYYRFCTSSEDSTQNYIRYKVTLGTSLGLTIDAANMYGRNQGLSNCGFGFIPTYNASTQTFSRGFLGLLMFTPAGLVRAGLYGPGQRANISYNAVNDTNQILKLVYEHAEEIIIPGPGPGGSDPYSGGGTSEPGGGDGDFDFSSTDIPIPTLPAIGSYDTGFISLYNPTASQLKALAAYMWSGAFDLDNFRKLVADPMDAILGLHIIPTIAGHPATGSATLMVGNISTGITMPTVTEQYYELDCGTINISPKWGAYLDYSPYSKLTLFLPYIGFVPISPDDCMGGTIRVVYHVDVLSGTCCAYVYCESNRGADGHTLYTFTGSCACDCPVTEGQYTNALFGMLGVVGGIAQVAMSAGVAGAAGIPGTAQGLQNVANAAISMAKPDIARSGDFGGSAGLMGIQYPYLVLTVPRMCTPEDQNIYIGYPSCITKEMSELSGYTEIQVSHLSGMSCTSGEADEIIALLGGGVIF